MTNPLLVLSDADLFGNDAAEDEDPGVFAAYAMKRPEVDDFLNNDNPIRIARAYKGEGKSALLRLIEKDLLSKSPNQLVLRLAAGDVVPKVDSLDLVDWTTAWKASLLSRVAAEIGRTLGFVWNDDGTSLVEEAERQGARPRSFFRSLLDRMKGTNLPGVERTGSLNIEGAVKRWAEGGELIWLLIDDVDQNFDGTPKLKCRTASFFMACRDLVRCLPQIRIRAAVRPNVWTILKMDHEALSKVEQYITDLRWEERDALTLLAKRVEGYLRRRGKWEAAAKTLPHDPDDREYSLVELAFESPMPWGEKRTRPAHVVLFTLSKHRPRWLVELARTSGVRASKAGKKVITKEMVVSDLTNFGRLRIQDTVAEFKCQCPEVEELIGAFNRGAEQMKTADLLTLIERKILNHLTPRIAGTVGTPSPLKVASFLFEIGIFYARRDNADGSYEHFAFAQKPSLLRSRTDPDEGMQWEVHPVFRQALELRDASGRERRNGPRRR